MKIAVKDLHPNPFRDMKRYPINAAKVESLKASISETSFWDNIVARTAPDGKGFQAAYGHHRREALNQLKIKEIDIPVRVLDDETMLKMLAHENMEEWGADATIVQETIRAVVLAFAEGKIELAVPSKNTDTKRVRYAPSFIQGSSAAAAELRYTASTLTGFLKGPGWSERKISDFLCLLEMEETHLLDSSAVNGLTASAVQEITRAVTKYKDPKVTKAVAAGLAKSFGKGELSTSSGGRDAVRWKAIRLANEVGFKDTRDTKKERHERLFVPSQNEAAKTLAVSLRDVTPPFLKKAEALAEVVEHIAPSARSAIYHSCKDHAAKWSKLAELFGKGL